MIYNINTKYNEKCENYKYESYLILSDIVKFQIHGAFIRYGFKQKNTQININIKPPETAYIYLFDGVNSLEIEIENCK